MKQEKVWWIWQGQEFDVDKHDHNRLIQMGWVIEFWAVYAHGDRPLYASGPVERYREGTRRDENEDPEWPTRQEIEDGVAMPFSCHPAVLTTLTRRRDEFTIIPEGAPIPARIFRRVKEASA